MSALRRRPDPSIALSTSLLALPSHALATATIWLGIAVALGLAFGPTAAASDEGGAAGSVQIDAIYVERTPAWWLVDDGVPRATTPRWVADGRASRELGARGARDVLDAIEAGEGGGFVDGSGLGAPAPPERATSCGIPLVAVARDVAVVFLRDGRGRPRLVRASRIAESIHRAAPTPPPGRAISWSRDPRDPLGAARWRALLGDATETLRFARVARTRASPADAPSLDLLEAQALERLGRFREAADALVRFADRSAAGARDPSLGPIPVADAAREARRQADRIRGRAGDPVAPGGEGSELDAALGTLPSLVAGGRTLDAVGLVARAIRSPTLAPIRSTTRRRALLAATALALDAGDVGSARTLLGVVSARTLADDLEPVFDALLARAESASRDRAVRPPPQRGSPAPGR